MQRFNIVSWFRKTIVGKFNLHGFGFINNNLLSVLFASNFHSTREKKLFLNKTSFPLIEFIGSK